VKPQGHDDEHSNEDHAADNPRLHLLLPASNRDVNLCKTLLSARALGYPNPVVVAWDEHFDTEYLLGGGSHLAKVSKVLEYLQSMPSSADEDLVLMMDAFDIWFQLRPETLISRYRAVNDAANERIANEMGASAEKEGIQQKIIFGAGKRCAPNQVHTLACYPVPLSPVPDDIYGENTDTIMGINKYTSLRQRYLNSGYVIGPVKDMKPMFERAWQKMQNWPNPDPEDNGSHGSDFTYHGSDQSVFNLMFGEQEFQREVIRRRHETWYSKKQGKRPKAINRVEGTIIGDDILNPPFSHQTMDALPGKPCEFGIGLDYFSDLGHQTANAESDGRWMTFDQPTETFVKEANTDRGRFHCKYRGKGRLPTDVLASRPPFANLSAEDAPFEPSWTAVPLYTNLCMDRIPVMVHHNGDKSAREHSWANVWFQKAGRAILEEAEASTDDAGKLGAFTDSAGFLSWSDMCPSEYAAELFRDKGEDNKTDV